MSEMNIHYYFRNKQAGYSIQTVFQTIINQINKFRSTRNTYLISPYAGLIAIIKNCTYAFKRQKSGEINHITGDVHYLLFVLKKKSTIVTVHDIMYYHYLKGIKKFLWKILYIYPLKRAACVVFISEYSKQQVLDIIDLSHNRIKIIPDPVNPAFSFVEKKFNDFCPRILHIGTNDRKNLYNTILALKGIACHLRIIGHLKENIVKLLSDCKISYSNVYDLEEEQIIKEYIEADIINFPSLYEGFGMPIIEGQATGRVVVTSNIPPMKDVAGKGAILVNPHSVESIRNGYLKAISDRDIRNQVIMEGKKNVLNYTAQKVAEQYMQIYNSLLKYEKDN